MGRFQEQHPITPYASSKLQKRGVCGILRPTVIMNVQLHQWGGRFTEVQPGEEVVEVLGRTFEQVDKLDISGLRAISGLVCPV
jgi:hypothetical protein